MLSPHPHQLSHQNSTPVNQMVSVQSEPSFFNGSRQVSLHYQSSQQRSDKPQILVAPEIHNQQQIGAILDLKQSAKSIGDTLIYVFSQFLDHISNNSNQLDFEFMKSEWRALKTHLQPFNQQKVSEFFKKGKSDQNQSTQNSYREIASQPSNININLNNISYNHDTSIDPIKPTKSMPTSTRNNQSIGNVLLPNGQETMKFNDMVQAFNTVQNTTTHNNANLFLNSCQSPSAPSLLPNVPSSHTPPPITQQKNGQQSINQSVNSSSLLLQQLQFNNGLNEMTSPLYTMTSVSRCNSFTTNGYPQVSNFDINTTYNNNTTNNNQNNNINNQSMSALKKDQQGQSSLQQQGLSMTSRSKKEAACSQYKAVPISTFKLDVPRMNKHMHQYSNNSNQGVGSQTNIPGPDQEQSPTIVSPFLPTLTSQQQANQQNCSNKRGNSQSQTRLQSPTNFQQHQNFLQQQRESLARQTSQSQERSMVSKLMYDSKTQPLTSVNYDQQQTQGCPLLQRTLSNQQMSPKQLKKELSSQQQLPSSSNLGSNFNSINAVLSSNTNNTQPQQQNQGLSINSSISLSQRTLNQIIQQQQSVSASLQQMQSKPLQGITLLSNNNNTSIHQQQSAQKCQLNQSNSKTQINPQHNFSTQQATLYTEEACKENDRFAYYFTKESDQAKEQNENKFFFDKTNQSAGKPLQKQSQNKVINLNSYQVSSQYGSKTNLENCLSPSKAQHQQQSKSFNTKNLFQSPTISIQNLNGRVHTEANNGKTYRMKTETDAVKNKGNTIEQLLSTQISNDQIYESSSSGGIQSQRSTSKYSANSSSSLPSAQLIPGTQIASNFQANFLKSKISNLLSVYEENNIIINAFKLK